MNGLAQAREVVVNCWPVRLLGHRLEGGSNRADNRGGNVVWERGEERGTRCQFVILYALGSTHTAVLMHWNKLSAAPLHLSIDWRSPVAAQHPSMVCSWPAHITVAVAKYRVRGQRDGATGVRKERTLLLANLEVLDVDGHVY